VSARFLLDTNAIREPLRPTPNPRFLTRFQMHSGSLAIAAPAWQECLYGLYRMPQGRKREQVDEFLHGVVLATIDILPYDMESSRWHAAERARLEREGRPIPFADGMIAAVGVRFGLTIVTHDITDFEAFSNVALIDWCAP
jgi:tRNA(fMet)-specific endonuclease VapC